MAEPFISICIPTYGRVEILKQTLESILSQKTDKSLYEICITDNSPTDETKALIEKDFSEIPNLHYKKVVCEGYLNSIEALKSGNGKYLKLHNNYTKLKPDALSKMISTISLEYGEYKNNSVIFFGGKALTKKEKSFNFNNFDDFMNFIHIQASWSSSFGIWKQNLDALISNNLQLDKMFPHTSLLFNQYESKDFLIDDSDYFENQAVGKKGGYNLPDTFCSRYFLMNEALFNENKISNKTFAKIKNNLLKFTAQWFEQQKFYSESYCFDFSNMNETIKKHFAGNALFRLGVYKAIYFIKYSLKKLLNK